METKIKTVFELETCGFVIHQNYTISAWIDTKKMAKKTVSQRAEIHSLTEKNHWMSPFKPYTTDII